MISTRNGFGAKAVVSKEGRLSLSIVRVGTSNTL